MSEKHGFYNLEDYKRDIEQRLISEFVKDIGYYTDGCDDELFYGDESNDHKYWMEKQKKWEEKLK